MLALRHIHLKPRRAPGRQSLSSKTPSPFRTAPFSSGAPQRSDQTLESPPPPKSFDFQNMPTRVLIPYWVDGVQKLKVAPKREFAPAPRPEYPMLMPSRIAPPKPAHGLTPPALDDSLHTVRCLNQLRSKDKSIEKYIYLTQLRMRIQIYSINFALQICRCVVTLVGETAPD